MWQLGAIACILCLLCGAAAFRTEGRPCDLGNNKNGICVKESECGYPYGAKGKYCEKSDDDTYILCCNTSINLSERACSRYNVFHLKMHTIGGDPVKTKAFPYLVALGFVTRTITGEFTPVSWLCGGVLISEKYILTAAHCSVDPLKGQLTQVRITDSENADNFRIYNVEDIIPHENFEPPSKHNDIALIKLQQTVEFSKILWPPCIRGTQGDKINVKKLQILGWESPYVYDVTPFSNPQVVLQNLISNEECWQTIKKDVPKQLLNGYFPDSMFCAKNSTADTCTGDSGSPVIQVGDGYHELVGITSFGYDPCSGGRPSVYTRVSHYKNWIECIVWPNE